MKIENLFDSTGSQKPHVSWRAVFESTESEKKELCNRLYSKFKNFSDSNFITKFKSEFFPAFWEMDLACTLLDSGFKLSEEYCGNKGPDLCLINAEGNRIWIEAVCVTRGSSLDEVSLGEPEKASFIDSEKIMLRLTSAICDKDRKHKNYLKQGICKEDESFVIAVNGSLLAPGPGLDDCTPRIVKAVFEGGRDEFIINKFTDCVESRTIDYRPEILKHNNNPIFTNFFRTREYENISALLFSESSLWSRPCETGSDYITVHNPLAANPLVEGFFQFGTEYILKQSKTECEYLKINNYRKQLEYLYE